MTAVAPTTTARTARLLHVTGVVQGVGFRPFVHRLAARHALAGWVRNQSGDVEIRVEGEETAIESFAAALRSEAPRLARVERVTAVPAPVEGTDGFAILESTIDAERRQPVPPDVSLCESCERELFDPADRRYRYPFITCTDCGPRYTVIESLPYDRERTTMRAFAQCSACRREYETPGDRRYHSETNSCPVCGPRLFWIPVGAARVDERQVDPVAAAAAALAEGWILALRGVGGFHLAVDATNESAVRRLRARKQREEKPLAVMVRTLEEARALASVGDEEAELLASRERPIVLLHRRAGAPLAPSVAPGLAQVGVMLAYSPLHHLLLERAGRPLVMTSGNLSEEPIAAAVDEALARLGGIADAFLWHDREIAARIDDSVRRMVDGAPAFLRRARGYAPLPVPLPVESPLPLVAVGPHLKNTFTLVHGGAAYVSQHIGDLDNLETLEHFRASLAAQQRLFRIEPKVVVRDRHPGYLSTRLAEEMGLPTVTVQHHHAHIAAVMAEHGVTTRVVGLAFDGTGYGDDGRVWGAEWMVADLRGYERVAQLRYAPLPGGDAAVRRPWRTALGYLSLAPQLRADFAPAFAGIDARERETAEAQAARGLNAPLASSMGRLFDAAAAVMGVRRQAHYEGQAAMELEALAGARAGRVVPMPVSRENADGRAVVDPVPLLAELGRRAQMGADGADLAASLHESIAAASAQVARYAAEAAGVSTIVLGGGCFQNGRLAASLRGRLERMGFRVLAARALPANDGGVSYGQAAVAAARLS
ncbi:MAG TPA: carbamoyltransferase HypF [Gemmatimonadaceae bacterium]|nr:carbamoyltransferase HypF [Gemmatimonadaceae bacterium]